MFLIADLSVWHFAKGAAHSCRPRLKVLYFGTPVVLVSSLNENGTANLAPMSSAWWLDQSRMLGLGNNAQTTANLPLEGECVLNLPSSAMVDAVDRIALTTGKSAMPDCKQKQGYRYEPDKFSAAQLTEQASDLVRASRVAECPVRLSMRPAPSPTSRDISRGMIPDWRPAPPGTRR